MDNTTRNELKQVIAEVIREEMKRFYQPQHHKTGFNINEAVDYLNSQGCPITKGSLYVCVSNGQIESHKSGKYSIFYRDELDRFAAARISKADRAKAENRIRVSARRKESRINNS